METLLSLVSDTCLVLTLCVFPVHASAAFVSSLFYLLPSLFRRNAAALRCVHVLYAALTYWMLEQMATTRNACRFGVGVPLC